MSLWLNKLKKEYCVKTKVIALYWQWVTLISWCQMNCVGHSSPVNCRTEPLQQTEFLFLAFSNCNKKKLYRLPKKTANKTKKKVIRCLKMSSIMPKRAQKVPKVEHCWHFWHFPLATFTNLVCCSDSVWQTKFPFFAMTQSKKQYWKKIIFVAWDKEIKIKIHPSKFEIYQRLQIALG